MTTPHERLRLARQLRGYDSPTAFSKATGVPLGTYDHHETARRSISVAVAKRYAKLLNINASWLLFGEGDMAPDATVERLRAVAQAMTPEQFATWLEVGVALGVAKAGREKDRGAA